MRPAASRRQPSSASSQAFSSKRALGVAAAGIAAILAVVLFTAQPVWAIEVPRAIALGNSDFSSRSLGSVCFGMDEITNGLPCNPAFAAKERDSRFQAEFFFGNNVSYISEVTELMDGSGNPETVNRLFSQKSSAEMEARVEASYLRENWGIAFAPYRLFYYSLIRNSALPVITLYAGQEQILTGQIASFAGDDFFWGVQLRAVDRKFILSEFTLTDALASGGSKYFETRNQRALYVEPGILYSFDDLAWRPQIGTTLKNAGFVDTKYEELATTPDWHIAGSLKPPVTYGQLELGLDLHFTTANGNASEGGKRDARDIPRFGASYRLGAMQALGSYGNKEYSVGFLLRHGMWNGGLTYWRKKFENLLGEPDQLQTVYLEFGFTI